MVSFRQASSSKASFIVQGVIAISCLAAIIYLAVTSQTVPDVLIAGFSSVLGFYFGKSTNV